MTNLTTSLLGAMCEPPPAQSHWRSGREQTRTGLAVGVFAFGLAISAILAALSSLQPTYAASRVAVRDALAYEG